MSSSSTNASSNEDRSLGVNISVSIKLLNDIDAQAQKEGLTRSELVRKALSSYLSGK